VEAGREKFKTVKILGILKNISLVYLAPKICRRRTVNGGVKHYGEKGSPFLRKKWTIDESIRIDKMLAFDISNNQEKIFYISKTKQKRRGGREIRGTVNLRGGRQKKKILSIPERFTELGPLWNKGTGGIKILKKSCGRHLGITYHSA